MQENEDRQERGAPAGDAPKQKGRGEHRGERQGSAQEWAREVEAADTDGRGTGGVGEDLGGYDPLPEPDQ